MRLINADTLPRTQIVERQKILKNGNLGMRHVITEVVRVEDLEKAPTVDAVPVVRCKECEYYTPIESGKPLCALHSIAVAHDDFCSYGERRSGDA